MAKPPPAEKAGPAAGRFRALLPGVLILGATVAAFLPALAGGFIWDDAAHVTANPSIVGSLGLARIWTSPAANYFPLTTSTFWGIHALWGLNPLPYHVINVLMHAASAVLLWLVLGRLRVRGAWLGALLWALHPVQVESAAWISELKNTQSAVFYLLAIGCFLRWVEAEPPRDHGDRWGYYLLAWLGAGLAILSKSSTVMLPVVLGLCWWWMRGRWRWRQALWLVPFLLVSAAAGAWTIWEQKFHSGALGPDWSQTLPERVVLSGKVFWFYLGKLLWPHPLIFIYPRWALDATRAGAYLPVLAAAGGVGWLWWRRHGRLRPVFFAAAVFAVSLVPVLGFFDVYFFRYSFVGDHFQYLASMAILALAGAGLSAGREWLGPGLGVALAGVLGALTWSHGGTFRDDETLYRATLAHNPGCWMAHTNLGLLWSQRPGRLADAIAEYETALRLNPDYAEAHNDLGNALAQTPGRLDDAIAQFREALRLNPGFAVAHFNLGNAWSQMPGRLREAVAEYEASLRLDPGNAVAHNNLGNALAQMPGRLNDAIAEYEAALRLQPDYVPGWYNLGVSRFQSGNLPAAAAAFREALRLSPDNPYAQQALAAVLRRTQDH